jgi:lathosterol oxidase
MLCEISFWLGNNFFYTWLILSLITFVVLMILSSILFYYSYVKISYSKWLKKCNPKYPSAENVRMEIILMLKGILSGTFCPSMTLYLMSQEKLKGYCGIDKYGWIYLFFTFFISWLLVDLFEFLYHRIGHSYDLFWNIHKSHHQFYNPTPFSVIAEDYIDQIIGASPLIILPAIVPINIDLLFFQVNLFLI